MRFLRLGKEGQPRTWMNPVLRWQKRLRRIFVVLIAASMVWLFAQVGRYTIAQGNDAMKGVFEPGTSVLYDRFFEWHNGLVPFFGVKNRGIVRGNVVIFVKKGLEVTDPGTGEKMRGDYYGISRVVGVPGDEVRYVEQGVVIMENAGQKRGERFFRAPHPHGTAEPQEIPPDNFFILNDNPDSDIQDSRHFGYVRGGELGGKVVGAFRLW